MATAIGPTDLSVAIPSSSSEGRWLEPPGDVLYEVVDGRVVELPPMGAYESDIANWLAEVLTEIARAGRLGRVFVELLFRIDVTQDLRRRPDIAFVSAARWPYGRRVPKGEAWDMVPDLAVEVVSKSNTADEILAKLGDYFRTGVRLVWVVYPSVREVYVYTSPTDVQILAGPAVLDGGEVLPNFHISLHRLFEDEPDADGAS
jgi:Uma2 family endonuclease